MPQLWLTYHELAEELGGGADAARQTAIARAWTRKHSRDGHTRVLMPPDLMQAYFETKAFATPPRPDAAPPALEQLRRVLTQASSAYRQ